MKLRVAATYEIMARFKWAGYKTDTEIILPACMRVWKAKSMTSQHLDIEILKLEAENYISIPLNTKIIM